MKNSFFQNFQNKIREIVCRFLPDDVATPEDIADIEQAEREFLAGEYVRYEDINWK